LSFDKPHESVQTLRKKASGKVAVFEAGAEYNTGPEMEKVPPIDFSADPEIVRVVVEGECLTYGHLFNPTFATEISKR
jgi:hypothetical protein